MTLEIITLEVTAFSQNCRILYDSEESTCIVIDPGGDSEKITNKISKLNRKISEIWLTHSHLDHCGGVRDLLKKNEGIKLLGSIIEKELRQRVEDICKMYGLIGSDLKNCPEPDQYIEGGEKLKIGKFSFDVLSTPGHSPGHLSFYCADANIILAGDTVFYRSIGRTDLPGGDHKTLISNIKKKVLSLPPETRILSGHGPETTVGEEMRSNPFLLD